MVDKKKPQIFSSTPAGREPTPGELYKEIEISRKQFEEEPLGGELVKEKPNWYVNFCKSIYRQFPQLGKGAKFQKEYKEALDFLRWDISAEELAAAGKFVLFAGLIIASILAIVIFFVLTFFFSDLVAEVFAGMDFLLPVYIFAPLLIAAIAAFYFIQSYPVRAARAEQMKALTYISEIIGYMIMSIKLVPNLEKAVEFAAQHGKGRIAEDFKRLLWDVQIGVYSTLSEGLDAIAYRWGNYSPEFKQALMRIRASVLENTEAKRYAILDQTMNEVLESIKNKMDEYARSLNEPSVVLFYLGVLLPLILIIILPVGSTFSGAPLANPIILFLIYNVLIPAVAFAFAFTVVKQRPPTYKAPIIPDNYPGLPGKWKMYIGKQLFDIRILIAIVFILGLMASLFIAAEGIPPRSLMEEGAFQFIPATPSEAEVLDRAGYAKNYFEIDGPRYNELLKECSAKPNPQECATQKLMFEKQIFFMQPANDITPLTLIFGILLTLSICAYIYLYYSSIYKRRVQIEIMAMESEFKESLYVIASRMGENKPIEEALKHAKEFLPNLKISQTIFARTLDNISLLGMPLEAAIFDPNYGSMKYNPSSIIRGGLTLLVDSVQLGVNMAARSLMSLSIQLSNAEKVNLAMKTMISEIAGMMRSMGLFIAPIVLGVTTGLQKIVILTISSIASSGAFGEMAELPSNVAGSAAGINITEVFTQLNLFNNPEIIGQLATPTQFIFIVAFYIIELVIIMTFFVSKLEEDNDLVMRINIARALPIAVAVFVVTVFVTNALLVNYMPGA